MRLKTLFVTYCTIQDDTKKSSQIGVLKRCVRLIANMEPDLIESHMINFGMLPQEDPLLRQILPCIIVHNLLQDSSNLKFFQLFESLKPDIVVLGESPGSGEMLKCSSAASEYDIPQVCIENYYGPEQPDYFKRENPFLDQWLLLGLPYGNRYGRITENAVLVPPLLTKAENVFEDDISLTILGYDLKVAELSMELLRRLPTSTKARLIYSPSMRGHLSKLKSLTKEYDVTLTGLPTEAALRNYLASSKVVVCKSGFQQMIECLALGTPVITYNGPGTVPEALLAEPLRPYVCYFPQRYSNWMQVVIQAAIWLKREPDMPWCKEISKMEHPAKLASEKLFEILNEIKHN